MWLAISSARLHLPLRHPLGALPLSSVTYNPSFAPYASVGPPVLQVSCTSEGGGKHRLQDSVFSTQHSWAHMSRNERERKGSQDPLLLPALDKPGGGVQWGSVAKLVNLVKEGSTISKHLRHALRTRLTCGEEYRVLNTLTVGEYGATALRLLSSLVVSAAAGRECNRAGWERLPPGQGWADPIEAPVGGSATTCLS